MYWRSPHAAHPALARHGELGARAQLAFRISDEASFVNGVCWYIDGGAHLWGDSWIIPDSPEVPLPPAIARLADR